MPLHKGTSRKVIGENIKEMEESGHKKSQAVAAALNEARESRAHIPKKKEHHEKHHHKGHMERHDGHKDGHHESHHRKHHHKSEY